MLFTHTRGARPARDVGDGVVVPRARSAPHAHGAARASNFNPSVTPHSAKLITYI